MGKFRGGIHLSYTRRDSSLVPIEKGKEKKERKKIEKGNRPPDAQASLRMNLEARMPFPNGNPDDSSNISSYRSNERRESTTRIDADVAIPVPVIRTRSTAQD
jgi:hypothetical protein